MTEDGRRMRAAVETIENLRLEISTLKKRCARYERALNDIKQHQSAIGGELAQMSGTMSIVRQALQHT